MDYSPWPKREIWPFMKVAISPKPERPCPPKLVCMHLTSIPTCIYFLSWFRLIKIFDVWKGNLAVFESMKVAISPKPEKPCPPKLVCMHLTSITTSINFLSWLWLIIFFDDHGLYIKVNIKEIWLILKVAISLKPEKPCPPKLVCLHLTSIPTCLNFLSWFQSIKIFDDHGLKGKIGQIWK